MISTPESIKILFLVHMSLMKFLQLELVVRGEVSFTKQIIFLKMFKTFGNYERNHQIEYKTKTNWHYCCV